MNENNSSTYEEKKLAADIMTMMIRSTAKEYDFLRKPIYSLKAVPDEQIDSIGADYLRIYYNVDFVISRYRKNKKKLMEAVVHCVLHSLLLHPSHMTEENELFNAAADAAVFCMMKNANALACPGSCSSDIDKLNEKCPVISAQEILACAKKDPAIKTAIFSLAATLNTDDHSVWYRKEERKEKDEGNSPENVLPAEMTPAQLKEKEQEWSAMLSESKGLAAKSNTFGSMHGGMFTDMKKPDRFSRFSYTEYLMRFARHEIAAEDPETLDLVLYNWGVENLDDTPIVEYCETKEHYNPTDIIIAIDMSGSCGGETASNFLRQIYSIFSKMNIRGTVNIKVVTFDTTVNSEFTVRTASDADRLLSEYKGIGWGGTDFNCVFDYADNFSAKNRGRRLKGLFFFSDACGSFPNQAPKYKTTFFVPEEENIFMTDYCMVPEWVDLVRYDDH